LSYRRVVRGDERAGTPGLDGAHAQVPLPVRPWTHATLVAALLGPPLFAVASNGLFGELPPLRIQVVLQLLYCVFAASVVWVVLRRERLPLRSIGVKRPTWSTLAGAILVALVALYVLPLATTPLIKLLGTEGLDAGLQRLAALPAWFRVFVGVTGGAVEELLYRGFAVERLAAMTGRRWLAGTLAALAFGFAHVPAWGLAFSLVADLPFGILMTAFYLWRRDLLANVLAHSGALVVSMFTAVT
jgi:membrane protease YdiL (CAAX protease family)